MKKVGLVTLYSKNYGSTLQCYSLKNVIQKFGYDCVVLTIELDGDERYYNKFVTLLSLVSNSMIHPSYAINFFAKRLSSKNSINSLENLAASKIDSFVFRIIAPRKYSLKQLKKIGKDDQFYKFISGSDQVWNGISPYQPFYFLEFAKDEKKAAYAPSFGGNVIASYNKSYFKKTIKKFCNISVRENEGVKIVKELTGRDAVRVPDPTLLLTNEEWKEFSCEEVPYSSYIFVHFLDKPNDNAIHLANLIQKETGKKLIIFSYMHDEFQDFDALLYNGTPEEYVGFIRKADYVLTDSFHTTLFALRFARQIYVFDRLYRNGQEQSSRIVSLLENTKQQERLIRKKIRSLSELPNTTKDIISWMEDERNNGLMYLAKSVLQYTCTEKVLKSDSNCTGCGVCVSVCPVDAISMVKTAIGYNIPNIDKNKCIKCNKCINMCLKDIGVKNRSDFSYIAYSINEGLRNKAASGGVFASIASQFIEKGGIVCGATLYFEKGVPIIKHILINDTYRLPLILGSKYVQSDCIDAYSMIKSELASGRKILFCGTSCQVVALKKYIGGHHDNLFTIDLVCHGVPGQDLFRDYINYIEKKKQKQVVGYSFRDKDEGKINYAEKITYNDGTIERNSYDDSLFCKMFLNRVTYREQCYSCDYAKIDKPADLTIGDYFEAKNDYSYLFSEEGVLHNSTYLSCLLVNSSQGENLINEYGEKLIKVSVDLEKIQLSHQQLCVPSKYPNFRDKFMKLYNKGGFLAVERYYLRRNALLCIPREILKK